MKEIVKITTTFLADSEVIDQIVGDTEAHTVASEPYMGKGRLFGFLTWNSSYNPKTPSENSEFYTGKK